jgi:hypothetical protein
MNLTATGVKTFVPAKNFEESLTFYKAMGWKVNFHSENNDLAELELAGCRFYLGFFAHDPKWFSPKFN